MAIGGGFWSGWLILVAVSFAVGETWAITHKGKTLSRVVSDAALGWPLLPFIYGSLFSGLAVHFFWHFC